MIVGSVRPLTLIAMRPVGPAVALGVDQLHHARPRGERTHDELLVVADAREAGQEVEEFADVAADGRVVASSSPKSS